MLASTFRRTRVPGLALLLALALLSLARRDSSANARPEQQSIAALAVANDNRSAAGSTTNGVLTVLLDARPARWLPDADVDSTLTVQAFAEQDGVPRIPGPLIRAAQGTTVRVTVINSTGDSTLVLHGLPAGGDSVVVPAGQQRVVEFAAGAPGTYLYWASTTGQKFVDRTGRDAQLTGALIIDPAGVPAGYVGACVRHHDDGRVPRHHQTQGTANTTFSTSRSTASRGRTPSGSRMRRATPCAGDG